MRSPYLHRGSELCVLDVGVAQQNLDSPLAASRPLARSHLRSSGRTGVISDACALRPCRINGLGSREVSPNGETGYDPIFLQWFRYRLRCIPVRVWLTVGASMRKAVTATERPATTIATAQTGDAQILRHNQRNARWVAGAVTIQSVPRRGLQALRRSVAVIPVIVRAWIGITTE